MLRALLPYFFVSFVISAFAGIGHGQGFVSVAGVYGLATLALFITLVGGVRWDIREYGPPRSRR